MRRRDALATILSLGASACGPRLGRRSADPRPAGPTGPVRVGGIPMRPVGGGGGGGPAPIEPPINPPSGPPIDLAGWRRRLGAARDLQTTRLREYARRRMFPLYLGPDGAAHVLHRELTDREPVFVDHRGVHCAVGYLMDRSGWSASVDAIVRTDNNIYVEEVEDGDLVRWIEVSGLTQQEAAFVQPGYSWLEPDPAPAPRPPPPPDDIVKPPDPDHIAAEVARLVEHFAEVDAQLRQDRELSLDEALVRLKPRLEARLPVGQIS